MYQHGVMNGFDNVKTFVCWIDENVYQQCKRKSRDNKLEVHNIQSESMKISNEITWKFYIIE